MEERSTFRGRAETTYPKDRLRVLVLGSKGVGKTSIVRQFIREKIIDEYQSAETQQQFFKCDKVTVELMDVGNFLLPSLKRMAINTADAFVLVYAVDNIDSFNFICSLQDEIIEIKGKNTPIVVAGNKVDTDDRKIHPVVADCIVTMDHECPHVEVSAKEALELMTLFKVLFRHPSLYQKLHRLSNIQQCTRSKSITMNASPVQCENNVSPNQQEGSRKARKSISLPWRGMLKLLK